MKEPSITDVKPLSEWTASKLDAAILAETLFGVTSARRFTTQCTLVAYDLAPDQKFGAFCLPCFRTTNPEYVFTRDLWSVFSVVGEVPGYLERSF